MKSLLEQEVSVSVSVAPSNDVNSWVFVAVHLQRFEYKLASTKVGDFSLLLQDVFHCLLEFKLKKFSFCLGSDHEF